MRYSPEVAKDLQRNFGLVREEIRESLESLFSQVEPSLKNTRAREFLRHGVCRRLTLIQQCILNIFTTFSVDRTDLLGWDELGNIDINLHAFLINSHGIPDNLVWVYLLERGINLAPREIGLFNPRTQLHLPQEVLTQIGSEGLTKWHEEYAKNYRDALAHRIPPYVAPSVFTPEHQARYEKLEREIVMATKAGDLVRALALSDEQAKCGSVCLAFAQSFLDEKACDPVLLHAQLIVDARTVLKIITVMHPHLYCEG